MRNFLFLHIANQYLMPENDLSFVCFHVEIVAKILVFY